MFYGWYIVFASYLAVISSMVGHSFGVTMFLNSWQQEFNLSKIDFSWIWLIACVLSGLLTFVFGFLIEKFGASKILHLVSIIYICVISSLSFVQEIYQLGILITLTRLLGPEIIMLICQTTIAKWFDKKLGKVTSTITWVEMLFMAGPIAINACIINFGWRNTYRIIAGLNLLLLIPINLIIVNKPSDKNCLPDGNYLTRNNIQTDVETPDVETPDVETPDVKTPDVKTPDVETLDVETPDVETQTANKAYYNPLYWILIIANTLFGLFWSGFNIMAPDILGLTNTETGLYLFLPITITLIVGATMSGLLIDYFDKIKIIIYCIILQVFLSILIIVSAYLVNTNDVIIFGIFYGLVIGQWITCFGVIFAKIFGVQDLAEIQGISVAFAVISSGVGPVLMSYSELAWGGYHVYCWIIGILISFVAFILSCSIYIVHLVKIIL